MLLQTLDGPILAHEKTLPKHLDGPIVFHEKHCCKPWMGLLLLLKNAAANLEWAHRFS